MLLALFVWSFYVVVGRICAPMIQGRSATGLGKGTGGESRRITWGNDVSLDWVLS